MTLRNIGTGTNQVAATADNQFWRLEEGDSIITSENYGFAVNNFVNVSLTVSGQIDAQVNGIRYEKNSESGRVVVDEGARVEGGGAGFSGTGDKVTILNYGVFKGGVDGVYQSGSDATIFNMGKMIGGSYGLYVVSQNAAVFNSGVINGQSSTGLYAHFSSTVGTIENSGKIMGDVGIQFGTGTAQLINTGEIWGKGGQAIAAGSSIQSIQNKGTITGDVRLGSGDDIFFGRGSVDGTVFGENGEDTLFGGRKHDMLDGGTGIDRLEGRAGNDKLWGRDGNDDIFGGAGNDKLYGGANFDELYGGAGNDFLSGGDSFDDLFGGSGNDVLKGGSSSDYLYGGTGNDKLFGGEQADTFFFNVNNVGLDRIMDFEDGADRLDLMFYGITNTTRFMSRAVKEVNGDVVIDMTKAGAKGTIIIEDAAGQIDISDIIF